MSMETPTDDRVVTLRMIERVALITMADRTARNTFSPALVRGLRECFAELARRSDVRVVVITGYDSYFCCGGTRAELLAMHEGRLRFSDVDFHDLLLRCELPVIAAMQGHAIGGGLAFGCFADLLVMAEEAFYSTNFLHYGFTPGFGASYIVPRKFGVFLGSEMLFSAANYAGWQLRERGAGARIVPRKEVVSTALALAQELAEKPLTTLKLLKRDLAAGLREESSAAVQRELQTQLTSFALPEVRERIEQLFPEPGAAEARRS